MAIKTTYVQECDVNVTCSVVVMLDIVFNCLFFHYSLGLNHSFFSSRIKLSKCWFVCEKRRGKKIREENST